MVHRRAPVTKRPPPAMRTNAKPTECSMDGEEHRGMLGGRVALWEVRQSPGRVEVDRQSGVRRATGPNRSEPVLRGRQAYERYGIKEA